MRRVSLVLLICLLPAAAIAQPRGPADASRGEGMRAYHQALTGRRLGEVDDLGGETLRARLATAEDLVRSGRPDDGILRLVDLVEAKQFDAFTGSEDGRAALYTLGEAYANAGVFEPARAYLKKTIADKGAFDPRSSYGRRAARKIVEIALETRQFQRGLDDLQGVPVPEDVKAEMTYLTGRTKEVAGDTDGAIAAYGLVPQTSRFWSQATYLSGLLHVEKGRLKEGETLFCKVADPKRQDRTTPVLADDRFFAVRDMARLALGRVAHEASRFDDARYYYYLVPEDSDRLAEALYEAATTRYEKKDFDGARQLLGELAATGPHHRYEDEALILGAYVDLAQCRFPAADQRLKDFVARYEPIRDAARRLRESDRSMQVLLHAARAGDDAGGTHLPGASVSPEAMRSIAALVRVDPLYAQISQRRSVLDHQASGLRATADQIAALSATLAAPGGTRAAVAEGIPVESRTAEAKLAIEGTRRAIDELEAANASRETLAPLQKELRTLEDRLGAEIARAAASSGDGDRGVDLPALLTADARSAERWRAEADIARRELEAAEAALAKDALRRLDLRLTRLLSRARLGRIESVLGKKRALEVEIEAIGNGLLPHDAVDSLDAARHMRDSEEYWPFEGDDWPDEYVGTEKTP